MDAELIKLLAQNEVKRAKKNIFSPYPLMRCALPKPEKN